MEGEYEWLPREEELRKLEFSGTKRAYDYAILDRFSTISEITKNLYLTSIAGITADNIRKHQINVLIDVCDRDYYHSKPTIEYYCYRIEDKGVANLRSLMDPFADNVHNCLTKGSKVLVHCFAGTSRSGALIIAYLMKYRRLSLKDAYLLIYERRSVVRPNNGFFCQLIDYELHLFGKISAKMIEYKSESDNVTLEIPDFFLNYEDIIAHEIKWAVQSNFYYNY